MISHSARKNIVSVPPQGRRRRILCFGDSLTLGTCENDQYEPYGKTLSESLAKSGLPCEVVVRGLGGCSAREMAAKVHSTEIRNVRGHVCSGLWVILQSEAPLDLVLIMLGTNDLGMGDSPKTIVSNVARLHDLCHMRGIPTILLAPSSLASGPLRAGREQLADVLSSWAQSRPLVKAFIDSEELVPRGTGSALYDPDGLHFSAMGSRTLGQSLTPWLWPFLGAC